MNKYYYCYFDACEDVLKVWNCNIFKIQITFKRLKVHSHNACACAFESNCKGPFTLCIFCIFVCNLRQMQRMGSVPILCV